MKHQSIIKKITLSATPEQVFSALTDEVQIIKYFPLDKVLSTWELDGEVLYKGNIAGVPFTDYGIITEFEPAKVFSYRYWSDNHGTEKVPENFVTISYQLSTHSQETVLTVIQNNLPSVDIYQ
jgi:uncharacterized protein YndB with AHSA1/START domain